MLRSLLALGLALLLALPAQAQVTSASAETDARPTNVVLMIPDGFGPASATMARDYLRWRDGTGTLAFDSLQVGTVQTYSTSNRITDSAAGATAYATGTKTYNGAIAVDTAQRPLGTLLQGAERQGQATGLVATSRLTHATPAAFSAHVPDRGQENRIADQQLTHGIEVLLGGGRRHFRPQSMENSARNDDHNLLATARQKGYEVVGTASDLAQASGDRLLGLFSNGHMAYEIDRADTQQPSLATMTETAIERLSAHEDGFFLMVEGSRIDHAGHSNDPVAHLHDILAFNKAVQTALATTDARNTLVVIVSDHETGGMSLARSRGDESPYAWHPSVLSEVTASSGVIADSLRSLRSMDAEDDRIEHMMRETVAHYTGLSDLRDPALDTLMSEEDPYAVANAISRLVSRRSLVGWTTHGHTAVDVNLYAHGPGANRFIGHQDNTTVGEIIADLMDVNLDALTRTLRAETTSTE
jgi:alkaline phosphatase